MCGIVGILGGHEVAPIILDALRRLEYRGYDSAGIATLHAGRMERRRATGKLAALSDLLVTDPLRGRAGIGHTRWATHGAATEANAHPHRAGPVAVVHNGIIENFRPLRQALEAEGVTFATDTDTETVAHLTARALALGQTPEEAVRTTLSQLEGAFALCWLFEGAEDLMIAARSGAPLAIGHGEGEVYVGSDSLALAPMTRAITYLEEGDMAILSRGDVRFRDAAGQAVGRAATQIQAENAFADKGRHKHFMAKEMHEQPSTTAYALSQYLSPDRSCVALPGPDFDFSRYDRVVMVACGTAYLSAFVAKYWFERIARLPVDVEVASEFRYREPPIGPATLALFISQSGETADTLAALRYCKGRAAACLALVNVPTSTIAREADRVLPVHAGIEVGVASTKAFTCQLAILAALACLAARQCGKIDGATETDLLAGLSALPSAMAEAMAAEPAIAAISQELAQTRDVLFLGRGAMYPLALEGALKLKEISYIHAEGYASGELKHGPLALVDDQVPVVVMAPSDSVFDKSISNMQEVMARGGKVLLISDRAGQRAAGDGVWARIEMPTVDPFVAPILYALPIQLLAYHTAVTKGTDVDQPRNLAKSVTVE
ncbi:MAG: glutamine--fructose-6-phosphate transaminase (isomerizing) [Pseudomonadota bacterium]